MQEIVERRHKDVYTVQYIILIYYTTTFYTTYVYFLAQHFFKNCGIFFLGPEIIAN